MFEDCIGLETCSAVYENSCINTKVNAFLSITNAMIDNCFPAKIVKVHKDDKLFTTGRIKQMISNRNKMYQRERMEEDRSLRNKIISNKVWKEYRNITVKKSNLLVVPIQSSGGKYKKHY